MSEQTAPKSLPALTRAFRSCGCLYALYGVLALILLAAIMNLIGSVYYGSQVKARLAELQEAGEPLGMAELAPAHVSSETNAADLYLKAGEIVSEKREGPDYSDQDYYTPEKLPALFRRVERDKEALEFIRQATAKPKCRFSTDWEKGFDALFPHYAIMRQVARFLRTAAIRAAYHGDIAEALEIIRMGTVLADRVGDEPILIGALVGVACDSTVLRSAPYALASGTLPEAEARRLAQSLDGQRWAQVMSRAMVGERAGGIDFFGLVRREPARTRALMGDDRSGRSAGAGFFGTYGRVLGSLYYADMLVYLDYMNGLIEVGRGPWPQAFTEMTAAERDFQDLPKWHIVTRMIAPAFTRAYAKGGLAATSRALAKIAIGLELYKQRNGAYPDALSDLSSLDWDVPTDPFSGKPLIYRREGASFVLYGIGDDGDDDGGKPVESVRRRGQPFHPGLKSEQTGGDPNDGDLVWRRWEPAAVTAAEPASP